MADPKTFEITAADGLILRGYRWDPPHAPRATVQIAHGMSEHARRYAELAERLAARGLCVVADDHRGHGASVLTGQEPGHLADEDGWNKCVDDLHRFNRKIAADHPGLPRVVFGHSMGSFLVQQLAFEHPEDADAVALFATNGKPQPIAQAGRLVARLERMRLGKLGRSTLLDKLSFQDFNRQVRHEGKPSRTPFDWISRDERAVDSYVADPLCGAMVTTQTWIDMLDALPRLTRPENLAKIPKALPCYIAAGERDPVGLMGKGAARLVDSYRAAGLTDVQFKLYRGARHELHNETNKEEVFADLLAWIDCALAKVSKAA